MDRPASITDRLTFLAFRTAVGLSRPLPYRKRADFFSFVVRRVFAPLGRLHGRMDQNLSMACPELTSDERDQIIHDSLDNMGRAISELYGGPEFQERCSKLPFSGPGAQALEEALENDRRILIVSGHFGNFEALRAVFKAKGYRTGALYRPFNNSYFNQLYHETMSKKGDLYARDRRGLAKFLRHLRDEGIGMLLIDQHVFNGESLTFFGLPAKTSIATVEMAMRQNALVVPAYGVRQRDKESFEIVIDMPISEGDPKAMTQALNDSLEAQIRENMGQWMWSHRRWRQQPD